MHPLLQTRTHIVLIGPMGAGKTAIGRQLAALLGREFHDTDKEIMQRTGVDLGMIFEIEGEEGFRRREHSVLSELLDGEPSVIATGGGTVVHPANRELLAEKALTIYLKTSVEVQAARTHRTSHRPLLAGTDRRARAERLAHLFEQRRELYEKLAGLTFATDHKHVKTVAREIADHLLGPHGERA